MQNPITVICHNCHGIGKMASRNLQGTEITGRGHGNYGSAKFSEFVLRIAPNRGAEFGAVPIIS